MAGIGRQAAATVVRLLSASSGVSAHLGNGQDGGEASDTAAAKVPIRAQNVAAELAELGETVRYPAIQVYCEKLVNSLTEKFRTFSGTVHMAAEIRNSQDRLQGLQEGLEQYADALTQVLDGNRGDWGSGMYYAGGYQVAFGAVKHGGKNYIQVAKVTFEIGVSIS
jgi:hypothetical protein